MAEPPRHATLIVNAHSRRGRDDFARAKAALEAAGVTLDAALALERPGDLGPAIGRAIEQGAPMVIVGGGDGSLSSAVDHFIGSDCVFALLPLGTANSFARSVGIPLDLEGAVDVIANGQRSRVDLGMIDGDYYANCAAIGLAPLIAETIPPSLKRWFGRAGYLAWAAIALARFRPFELIVDGERVDATEVRIANGSHHGGTELVDEAHVQSGEIIIQAVLGRSRARLLWSWAATLLRLPHRKALTREFHGERFRLETHPSLPISIDGEIAAHTPVTVALAAAAIWMALPQPAPHQAR